jgi:hypothetical protein
MKLSPNVFFYILPYPPAAFDGKPRRFSGNLKQVVVVHESDQGFRWKVERAYIRWGTPYRGRHGLQYKERRIQ